MSEVRGVTGEDWYSYGTPAWHLIGPGTGFTIWQLGRLWGLMGMGVTWQFAASLTSLIVFEEHPAPGTWPVDESTENHFSTSPGGGGPRDEPASTTSLLQLTRPPGSGSHSHGWNGPDAFTARSGQTRARKTEDRCLFRSKKSGFRRQCIRTRGHSGAHRFY